MQEPVEEGNQGDQERGEPEDNLEVTNFMRYIIDIDVGLQRVIEEQLEAGQGAGLTTQEFEDRFFL